MFLWGNQLQLTKVELFLFTFKRDLCSSQEMDQVNDVNEYFSNREDFLLNETRSLEDMKTHTGDCNGKGDKLMDFKRILIVSSIIAEREMKVPMLASI